MTPHDMLLNPIVECTAQPSSEKLLTAEGNQQSPTDNINEVRDPGALQWDVFIKPPQGSDLCRRGGFMQKRFKSQRWWMISKSVLQIQQD